ncbi:MAG: histidine ammonia-lyase [Candidatus Thermoplasmatota archaeon]|nr:histidine ammonia-lyase [Candidatus Thermoplasmatota archaeon]
MIFIDGNNLTIEDVYAVSVNNEKIGISDDTVKRVLASQKKLRDIIGKGEMIYGINTGFGSLLNVKISEADVLDLQKNLIRSHSSGTGVPLEREYVRAMMVVRLNSLCKGYSAVSPDLIRHTMEFINRDITPVVPRYGSVGASGDLAPLAHVALTLMGEGKVFFKGKTVPSAEVLKETGLKPYSFLEKEGVAFINGTSTISGILSVNLYRSKEIIRNAILSAAISFEGLKGTRRAYTDWAVESRPHRGQIAVAKEFLKVINGSKIIEKSTKTKVQDPYSLRCIPQVYGAVLDTLNYARTVLTTEINSATDNPLVGDDEVISVGNFHGEPVALVSDFMAIAMTDLGNIIERRLARITDENLSGLPPFLVENSGLNSGFMIPQYTAAALCNRNKTLCFPSSADNIPTSANQEDHVSMGTNAAIKLSEIVENVRQIVSIEFLIGAQSLEFAVDEPSPVVRKIYMEIRKKVPKLTVDRPPYIDIETIREMMDAGLFTGLRSSEQESSDL